MWREYETGGRKTLVLYDITQSIQHPIVRLQSSIWNRACRHRSQHSTFRFGAVHAIREFAFPQIRTEVAP